jgi:hypothetical protein
MKVLPQSRQEWLGFVLLPFKAYTVIGPLVVVISASLARPRHTGATDVETLLVAGLFPCSAILLFTALVLALVGPKNTALPCAGFGAFAFIIGYLLLPSLAN